MRTLRVLGVIALFLATAASLAAQRQPPTFRTSSELVVVDLVPLDRQGAFVADLQPHEIAIRENGQRRPIEFVHVVRRAGAAGTDGQPVPAAAPSVGATGPPTLLVQPTDTVRLSIVVDLLTTTPEDVMRVKPAIASMVGELDERTEVMLATLSNGVTVVQPFTAERARLQAAVQALQANGQERIDLATLVDAAQRSCAVTGMPPVPQLVAMAKSMIAENRQQFSRAAGSLGGLSRAMAALPGRKHVVLYSRGYPLDPAAHAVDMIAAAGRACGLDPTGLSRRVGSELAAEAGFDAVSPLRAMADQANRSQVAFYTIDPRGLQAAFPLARDAITGSTMAGREALKAAASEIVLPQEFLKVVAADTGGRAFVNSNDLARGLRRAWADAGEYYLIGYAPASGRRKGAFHRIEVRTTRPNLSLTYRRGYYESTDRERIAADVEHALREPGAFAAAGLEAEATVDGRRLRVVAYIPPDVITFTWSGGQQVAEISLHALLRDERGRTVGGKPIFGRDVALTLTTQQVAALRASDNLEIPVEVTAPPAGTYELVLAVRDSGGWTGAHSVLLHIQ